MLPMSLGRTRSSSCCRTELHSHCLHRGALWPLWCSRAYCSMFLVAPATEVANTLWAGRLKQELEMKRVALELLRGRVEGSESAQLTAAAAQTEAKLGEARAAADAAREKKTATACAAQVGGDWLILRLGSHGMHTTLRRALCRAAASCTAQKA